MNCDIKKRTIMIFPQFENINLINEIREKYDPLAKHVSPHISLVFTFVLIYSIYLRNLYTSPLHLISIKIIQTHSIAQKYLVLVEI